MSINRLLFSEYRTPVAAQAIFRLLFSSYLLLGAADLNYFKAALARGDLYYPPFGPAMLSEAPPLIFFMALQLLATTLSLLLFVGFRVMATSLLLSLSLIASRLWGYSFGKVDHDILFVVLPGILAFSRWGAAYSLDALRSPIGSKSSDRDAWPFAFLALTLAFGMLNSAAQKVLGGWLVPSSHASIGWLLMISESNVLGKDTLASRWIDSIVQLPAIALEALDWITVAFEALFAVAIWRRRAFLLICLCGPLFHFGTWVMFAIYFAHQIPIYAAFLNWHAIFRCLSKALFGDRVHAIFAESLKSPFALIQCGILIWIAAPRIDESRVMLIAATLFAVCGIAVWTVRPVWRPRESNNH